MTKWWSGAGPRSKASAGIAGVLGLIVVYLCALIMVPALRSPVADGIARVGGVLVFLALLSGMLYVVFRPQFDRIAIRVAKSVVVVDGIDDLGALPGIAAAARASGATPVVIDHGTHPDAVRAARSAGARITNRIDLGDTDLGNALTALHLLSTDTDTNLSRLAGHDAVLGHPQQPVPVSIRIDDPWQAEMWRRNQPVFDPVRWQPEVISRYESTAGRIAADLTTKVPSTVYICGTSQLTFAVCVAAGRIPAADGRRAPRLCVVAPDGAGFAADVTAFTGPRGKDAPTISAIDADPSIEKLTGLITARGGDCAIVLAEDAEPAAGIRLAIRFPAVPIYRVTPTRSASADRAPADTAPHTAGLITIPLALP